MKPLLPVDEHPRPTHTPMGVDPDRQAETLQRLRELENAGRRAEWERNDLLVAQVLSHSLSRPDMARAIGVSLSRVNQIIRQHAKLLQDRRNAEGASRVAAHMPPGR